MKYLILFLSMILAILGQFFLKKGIDASSLSPNLSSIVKTIFLPLVFIGLTLYGLSAIVWLFVLQKFPLSVAYPSLALTYIVVVIMGVFLLREPLTLTKLIGCFLIVIGVYFLNKNLR